MRRLVLLLGGGIIGGVAGLIFALLFTPASGRQLRDGAQEHVNHALDEARLASEARRLELEDQLARLTAVE